MSVPVVLRRLLAERDQRRCAYCLTPCGRATVVTLQVNNPTVVRARRR